MVCSDADFICFRTSHTSYSTFNSVLLLSFIGPHNWVQISRKGDVLFQNWTNKCDDWNFTYKMRDDITW